MIRVTRSVMHRSPREDFNMTKMVCFHKRYQLGDEHEFNFNEYGGFKDIKAAIERSIGGKGEIAVMEPLYMMDHSGLSLSTSDFHDRFDSGQIGWIYIDKKTARAIYDRRYITHNVKERLYDVLESELTEYEAYLDGDVYAVEEDGGDRIVYGHQNLVSYMNENYPNKVWSIVDM